MPAPSGWARGMADLATIRAALLRVALPVAIVALAFWLGDWAADRLLPGVAPGTSPVAQPAVVALLAIYVVMLMLPFVPGIELGLALMMVLGPPVLPLVYFATVLALTLSFLIGRLVPERRIAEVFRGLRMRRAEALMVGLENLGTEERLAFLIRGAHSRLVPILLRSRYLAVAVAVNTPGNFMIGGGGGIGMIAGVSRLFRLDAYVLTIALAVTPLPIVMMLWPRSL